MINFSNSHTFNYFFSDRVYNTHGSFVVIFVDNWRLTEYNVHDRLKEVDFPRTDFVIEYLGFSTFNDDFLLYHKYNENPVGDSGKSKY